MPACRYTKCLMLSGRQAGEGPDGRGPGCFLHFLIAMDVGRSSRFVATHLHVAVLYGSQGFKVVLIPYFNRLFMGEEMIPAQSQPVSLGTGLDAAFVNENRVNMLICNFFISLGYNTFTRNFRARCSEIGPNVGHPIGQSHKFHHPSFCGQRLEVWDQFGAFYHFDHNVSSGVFHSRFSGHRELGLDDPAFGPVERTMESFHDRFGGDRSALTRLGEFVERDVLPNCNDYFYTYAHPPGKEDRPPMVLAWAENSGYFHMIDRDTFFQLQFHPTQVYALQGFARYRLGHRIFNSVIRDSGYDSDL